MEVNFSLTSDQFNPSQPIRLVFMQPLLLHVLNISTAKILFSEISNLKIYWLLTMDILNSLILDSPKFLMKAELLLFVEPHNILLLKSSSIKAMVKLLIGGPWASCFMKCMQELIHLTTKIQWEFTKIFWEEKYLSQVHLIKTQNH